MGTKAHMCRSPIHLSLETRAVPPEVLPYSRERMHPLSVGAGAGAGAVARDRERGYRERNL